MSAVHLVADPGALAEAVDALARGLVVAVPTDTVYGLAADPTRPAGVARVYEVKGRPVDVPLPVLVAGWDQLDAVADLGAGDARRLADRHWPGPLTVVVPRRAGFTADLGGPPSAQGTVGVRWPAHPTMQALCMAVGPLAVTSANQHGRSPATTAGEVAAQLGGLGGGVAVVLDGGRCDGIPSSVVDCTTTAGAVPPRGSDSVERAGDAPGLTAGVDRGDTGGLMELASTQHGTVIIID